MKVGITFGAYCPLHQGHIDVITIARKENDKCLVIVSGRNHDRGGNVLPLKTRYLLVKEYFSQTDIVVEMINNSELKIDSSKSIENWKIWIAMAERLLEKNNLFEPGFELTWYVGESAYADSIRQVRNDKVVLINRNANPISGTICRENPALYIDKIAYPFWPFLQNSETF